MLIKSLVTGAALALAISVGSASAAEDFSTTSAVPAEPLTASQMADVVGAYLPGIDLHPFLSHEQITEICVEWDAELAEIQTERSEDLLEAQLEQDVEDLVEIQLEYQADVIELAGYLLEDVGLAHLLDLLVIPN